MGEQTRIQTQTQPLPHHEPSSQPQPTAPVTETPTDLSQNPSYSSKIPVRPHKLRKLSSVAAADSTDGGDSANTLLVSKPSTSTTTKNRRRNSSQLARVPPSAIAPLSAAGEIDAALRHLRAADPLLADLIDSLPRPAFDSHQPPFLALTKNILYQQLAYKAGTSIYTRFVEFCGGEDNVSPDAVLSLSTSQLRQIGVSGRKAIYLYDLANKYKSGILSDNLIVGMDDKSLFTMLSMVKGIGSWSVHMFMIFSLHRPDVLPVSDVGVRKGVQTLYGLEDLPRPAQMEHLCEKWRPYRSVGSWYLWRLVEGKGNSQSGAGTALEGIMPLQQHIGQQEEMQQQHQLQLLEPINGTASFGACIWGR
ncbi:alkylbase DNA glycosidase-like protein mag2 [Actinidia eriantha]|uniref:alkylbase DNA glycosidase-like protein mag2 n=1 Tax=Actinidia eriantha TaxID=165200 RepID=UPI00258BB300|nr:alkylbase DNA glycosidase-like protein mag2 [Actinidia eriantha]